MVSSTPRPHFTPGKDPVLILEEAGHHQVVVKIHKKKSALGKGLSVTDTKYDVLVAWLLFQIVE